MDIDYSDFSFPTVLIKKYTAYGMDELDCMVVLVSDSLLKMEKTLLTCDILSSYMKAKKEDIDLSLSRLLGKNVIAICDGGKDGPYSSLDAFKRRLFDDITKDIGLREREKKLVDGEENIYSELEQLCGRTLSPIERDMVTKWLREGADEGMVKEACQRSLTRSGNISFKAADRRILEMERSEGRTKIGVSTVDEDTRKKKEIRDIILNTDWTVHDD